MFLYSAYIGFSYYKLFSILLKGDWRPPPCRYHCSSFRYCGGGEGQATDAE